VKNWCITLCLRLQDNFGCWSAVLNTAPTTGPSTHGSSLTDMIMSLPDLLRARSAMLVGSLELGAPLGRGSYGKVYKG